MKINKYARLIKETQYNICRNLWCKLCPLEYWSFMPLFSREKHIRTDCSACFGFVCKNRIFRFFFDYKEMKLVKIRIKQHYITYHPFEYSILNKGKYEHEN